MPCGERYAWHFDMLHDAARLRAFAEAFERLPPVARAVDLGCGSGVLGLLLLRRFPELQLVAFEEDPRLATAARRNGALNGLQERLEVKAMRSTSCEELPRASLVVAEARKGVGIASFEGNFSLKSWFLNSFSTVLRGFVMILDFRKAV